MERNLFEEPVSITIGLGYPADVESVEDAYAVLAEWPQGSRDPACQAAMRACRAALRGEVDAAAARAAFVRFAKRSGILTLAPDAVIAANARAALAPSMSASAQRGG